MFGRTVVVSVFLAFIAWSDGANADPELDAMLDGMERLCGEGYAGPLASRDRNHLRCMRAYTTHCALKSHENPLERGALVRLCKSIPECPHCVGAAEPAERCVVEFKRYERPSPFATKTGEKCERYLVDGMAHPGAPEADVLGTLSRDPNLMGQLPDCWSASDRRKYRSYCMCVERERNRSGLDRQGDAPTSRREWEKEYQAALARAEAAGCDLVLTR